MRRKWVLAAVVAFPMAFVGWIAWTVITALTADPMTQVEAASCDDAMHYADQDGLPKGAQDAKCTVRAWLDTDYQADLRSHERIWTRGSRRPIPAPVSRRRTAPGHRRTSALTSTCTLKLKAGRWRWT